MTHVHNDAFNPTIIRCEVFGCVYPCERLTQATYLIAENLDLAGGSVYEVVGA